MLNVTQIPAPRVPFLDNTTGLISTEWYRFLFNLYVLCGGGSTDVSLQDLMVGPSSPESNNEIYEYLYQAAPQTEDDYFDLAPIQQQSVIVRSEQSIITTTAAQTVIPLTFSYSVGTNSILVFKNGAKLTIPDYTETSASSITLATGAYVDDTIVIIGYFA